MTVHPRHVRALKLCMPGVKVWFEEHELDWREFMRNGIDADILTATGDAFALMVVEAAQNER